MKNLILHYRVQLIQEKYYADIFSVLNLGFCNEEIRAKVFFFFIFYRGPTNLSEMAGINTEGEGESSQPRRESSVGPSANGARLRARTDPFLIVCRCFSVFTSIAAILCIVANVLTAVRSIKNGTDLINSVRYFPLYLSNLFI